MVNKSDRFASALFLLLSNVDVTHQIELFLFVLPSTTYRSRSPIRWLRSANRPERRTLIDNELWRGPSHRRRRLPVSSQHFLVKRCKVKRFESATPGFLSPVIEDSDAS
ncbi:PREDICTED: uncharacterized protein LOC101306624 [Fragaria vesca subsp. vesca]